MSDSVNVNVLYEDDNSFVAEIDGKPVKLFKINIEELKINHKRDLYFAAVKLPLLLIKDSLEYVNSIINNIPTVDDYEFIANEVVKFLYKIDIIIRPEKLGHLVHHLIKDIDPNYYGKAQTFMRQINLFKNDLEVLIKFKKEQESIDENDLKSIHK